MPRIQLHDPMKHSIGQDQMFHAMFANALRQTYRANWLQRIRAWLKI